MMVVMKDFPIFGQGVLSLVTGDEEMKTMLRKDALRWMGGVKVSGLTPNIKMIIRRLNKIQN